MARIHNAEIIVEALALEPDAVRHKVGEEIVSVFQQPFDPPSHLPCYRLKGRDPHPDRKIVELPHDFVLVYTVSTAVPTPDVVIRVRAFGKNPLAPLT